MTFFITTDIHFDPLPDSDTNNHVFAMNRIPDTEFWYEKIDQQWIHFGGGV